MGRGCCCCWEEATEEQVERRVPIGAAKLVLIEATPVLSHQLYQKKVNQTSESKIL